MNDAYLENKNSKLPPFLPSMSTASPMALYKFELPGHDLFFNFRSRNCLESIWFGDFSMDRFGVRVYLPEEEACFGGKLHGI